MPQRKRKPARAAESAPASRTPARKRSTTRRKVSTAAPRRKARPVKAPASPAVSPDTAVAAPAATTTTTKKVPRVEAGQNWACEVCGMSLIVDSCGGVEEHVFLCCGQEMALTKKAKKKDKKKKKKKG